MMTNAVARRLFQLHDIPWQGKTDRELAELRPAFRAIHEACWLDDEKAWQAGHMIVVEESMVLEDGQLATFETRKMPVFTQDGQREGLVIIGRDVTERRKLEHSAQASSERYEALLKHASDGVHILDKNGVLLEAGYQFCTMLGYSCDEMLGMHIPQWSAHYDPDVTSRRIAQQFASLEPQSFETQLRRKDGSCFDVEIRTNPIQIHGQWVLFASARDITERKRLEAELQESLAHQTRLTQFNILLSEANQAIARAEDERSLIQELCDLAVRHTDIRLAWIGRPDDQGTVQILAAAGEEIDYLQGVHISARAHIPEGQGPAGRVWRGRKAIYDINMLSDPSTKPWRETAARSGMGFSGSLPIFRGGAIWAILNVYRGPERPFEADERSILDELARDIGFGLDRLDATTRERDAQAFNEALLNNLTAGVSVVRYPARIIERVNDRMLDLFNASAAEELIGRSMRGLFPNEETFQKVGALALNILAQGSGMLRDVPHRRLDGALTYIDLSGHKLPTKAGEPERIVWTLVDVTERHQLTEELSRQSTTDALTHLPNRRALETEMDRALARAQRNKKLLAVCILDLDDFKPVNDTYGHESGDEVLITLGKRLPTVLRRTDFVARLGGDEFVLLIEDLDDLDALEPVLNKVEQAITTPIPLGNGKTVRVGMSMGVVLYPLGDWETADRLLREADRALYESKSHKAERERSWVLLGESPKLVRNPVQQLLDNGALEVWYQPILDTRARKVVGVEALARLRDGDGKIWPPAEFLPQLREKDLFELSRQVLKQALNDLPILDAAGFPLWVSVNIDPHSVSDACVACLREMIAHGAVDPSRITLEILEGSDFLEQQAALEHLLALKAEGIRLALDDVGSAYASLLRMKDLPIDEIKLDQGFVRTLEERPQDLHFVDSIQDLAAGMGVDLVVEGVETDDILDAVMVLGVKFLQGYGIARPMPLAQLQEFLAHQSSRHQQHPTSLLGLYAAQLANHSTLKKAIRQNPRLVDYMTLVDATICPIHDDLRRLGLDDGGPLDRLHQEYHRAIAVMDAMLISSPTDDDWSAVDQAGKTLERAILEAFRKAKKSRDL
jgi:diguanylate cyclase (GGDEF)-like protein/PAS domain S-box-containing protein